MKSFCNINSYLWKSQINIPIPIDKEIEDYKKMIDEIEKEINYYIEIKDIWESQKINSYINSFNLYREKIDKIIIPKNKALEELKIKFRLLANKIGNIDFKSSQLNEIKIELLKKIKDSIFNPDENLYKIFEEKFESLKNHDEHSSDLNSNKFYLIQYAKGNNL